MQNQKVLKFTGNWFFDLGFLGFIKLMENVYEWNIDELEHKINKDSDNVFYENFVLAYLIYHSIVRKYQKEKNEKIKELNKLLDKLEKEREKLLNAKNEKSKQKIKNKLLEIENQIKNLKQDLVNLEDLLKQEIKNAIKNQSIKNFKLSPPEYARNFRLFGIKDFQEAKEYLKNLLTQNNLQKNYEEFFDKTLNPILFSQTKFSNILYCYRNNIYKNRKISINGIKIPLYLLILCFYLAFENINNRNIVFYTPDIEFTYTLNKKLSLLSQKNKKGNILEMTWKAIIDSLIELKSLFSLQEMYIIEYKNINNQQIVDLEYIGIPKIKADLLIDEKIRENLNKNLRVSDKEYINLLENFLKDRDCFKYILRHISQYFYNKINYINKNSIVYYLAAEIEKDKLILSSSKNPFGTMYIKNKELSLNVRKTVRLLNFVGKLFGNLDLKKEELILLFSSIKKNSKDKFLNYIFRILLRSKKVDDFLIDYINDHILFNDTETWRYYALTLVLGGISYEQRNIIL